MMFQLINEHIAIHVFYLEMQRFENVRKKLLKESKVVTSGEEDNFLKQALGII